MTTSLLKSYDDNFDAIHVNDETYARALRDLKVSNGDVSTLKETFLRAMENGNFLKTLHVLLNELCKVTEEYADVEHDHFVRMAREAIGMQHKFENQQWVSLGHRYKQLYFAVLELERYTDEHKDIHGNWNENVEIVGGEIRLLVDAKKNARAEIRFVEPLSIAFCKPAEHLDVGCWAKSGELIPRCKRMEVAFKWCANQDERLFNLFRMRNYRDNARSANIDYRLRIVDVSTKLHCTHYRGTVETPVKLGIPNIEAMRIGSVSFEGEFAEKDVSFDFQFRGNPEPKFVCFFTRRNWESATGASKQYKRTYHEGAAIKKLKLGIGTQANALCLDTANHRCRFNQLTTQCFLEYKPPIDERSTFFAFPYSKLFHSVFEPREGSRMFGSLTFEYKPYDTWDRYRYEDKFDVMCMFIWDGKFLELGKNVQRSGLTML